jgi:hypothetical protein
MAGAVLLGAGLAGAKSKPLPASEGWQLLSRYLYRDAAEVFRQAPASADGVRELGLAATLLNEPPLTDGKIERAQSILRGLVTSGADETTMLYARYLQARILHMHAETPVAKVEAAYREVIDAAPDSAVAQLAASHLALVLLYQRPDLSVPARIEAAWALRPVAANLQLPEVAVEYYRLLANAAMFYGVVDERVVDWLQKAHDIGSRDQLIQTTLALQVAETARATGQREKAMTFYREFLATAVPTDQRYQTAELRMQALAEGQK